MIKCSAPGKLMIAGEWAVLDKSKCIVAAIDRRVCVEVDKSNDIIISAEELGIKDVKAKFNGKLNINSQKRRKLVFIKGAIEATLKYIGEWKPFSIRSYSNEAYIDLKNEKKKIGFGSSASVVVATVACILKYHGFGINTNKEKERIYKLSTLAHYFAQGKTGSAFDVAASTYGEVIVYRKYDSQWLEAQLKESPVRSIVEKKWPNLYIKKIHIPKNTIIFAGWTKESASTPVMIIRMKKFKKFSKKEYGKIYKNISKIVEDLINAFEDEDREKILELINKNEIVLRDLTKKSKINVETEKLRKLSEIAKQFGGAGKLSGAGGGDIGIAVCFDHETAFKIKKAWKKSGLIPIEIKFDKGVSII